jgi:hypothetical protein
LLHLEPRRPRCWRGRTTPPRSQGRARFAAAKEVASGFGGANGRRTTCAIYSNTTLLYSIFPSGALNSFPKIDVRRLYHRIVAIA